MKSIIIILFVAPFLISSCNHLDSGTVVNKWVEPENTYTYTTYIMVGKVMIPQVHTAVDDEDWVVEIKGLYEGETIQEQYYINPSRYNKLSIGDKFCVDGNCWKQNDRDN